MTQNIPSGESLHFAPKEQPLPLLIESLDLDAQGIAHKADGKVVFVEGALPFELVNVNVHRKKNNWESGTLSLIHKESSQRVKPQCIYFGLHSGACGGCSRHRGRPGAEEPAFWLRQRQQQRHWQWRGWRWPGGSRGSGRQRQ